MHQLSFDHVHLVSSAPLETAQWYENNLGGKIVENVELLGAPQIYVDFGASMVIVRGQRPNEVNVSARGTHGIVDHFAFRVDRDFQGLCDVLKDRGVAFTMEPRILSEKLTVAFITAPDGVSIELMHRT